MNRRDFLRFGGGAAVLAALPACTSVDGPGRRTGGRMFTEAEIRARLGVSTSGIRFKPAERLGEPHFATLRSVGISKAEVLDGWDPRNREEVRSIARAARNQGVEIVSVHGPSGRFSSAYDGGLKEADRRRSVERAILEGEAALELGASIMVCHFGTTDLSEQSVRELLEHFKGTPLTLGGENVGKAVSGLKDSDLVADFVRFTARIDSDRFGLVLDLGHARDAGGLNPFVKEDAAYRTVASCTPWLVHVHLHDCRTGGGPDDHYPPFDGEVCWLEVFRALYDIQYAGCFMFEPVHDGYHSAGVPQNVLGKVGAFPRELTTRIAG